MLLIKLVNDSMLLFGDLYILVRVKDFLVREIFMVSVSKIYSSKGENSGRILYGMSFFIYIETNTITFGVFSRDMDKFKARN